jgi:hypothetical protein
MSGGQKARLPFCITGGTLCPGSCPACVTVSTAAFWNRQPPGCAQAPTKKGGCSPLQLQQQAHHAAGAAGVCPGAQLVQGNGRDMLANYTTLPPVLAAAENTVPAPDHREAHAVHPHATDAGAVHPGADGPAITHNLLHHQAALHQAGHRPAQPALVHSRQNTFHLKPPPFIWRTTQRPARCQGPERQRRAGAKKCGP